jgi:hypothetical protein
MMLPHPLSSSVQCGGSVLVSRLPPCTLRSRARSTVSANTFTISPPSTSFRLVVFFIFPPSPFVCRPKHCSCHPPRFHNRSCAARLRRIAGRCRRCICVHVFRNTVPYHRLILRAQKLPQPHMRNASTDPGTASDLRNRQHRHPACTMVPQPLLR